jgi:hypothetical protein
MDTTKTSIRTRATTRNDGKWNRTEQNRTEQNRTEQNRTEQKKRREEEVGCDVN